MFCNHLHSEIKENLLFLFFFGSVQYVMFSFTLSWIGVVALAVLQVAVVVLLLLNVTILVQKTNEKLIIGCLASATMMALLTIKYVIPQ